MTRSRLLAAALAAIVVVVLVAVLALRSRDDSGPPRQAYSPGNSSPPRPVSPTPGRPIGPSTPTTTPAPATAGAPTGESAAEAAGGAQVALDDARAVARRFARAWLAHAVGRAPLSALSDAVPKLQQRLNVVRGAAANNTDTAIPRARLVSIAPRQPDNPRALVARVKVTGTPELQAADLLLVWDQQRWRVADLAPR